ncbi:hypothetical protein QYF36_007056 [Acer negundo]|nr:hypothetical protein QYF36_007056 [Acer negundo]
MKQKEISLVTLFLKNIEEDLVKFRCLNYKSRVSVLFFNYRNCELTYLDELSNNETNIIEEDVPDVGNMEEDIDGDMADRDLESVSKLQKTKRYNDIMQKVECVVKGMVLETRDPNQYQLIVDCNELLVDIENEIVNIHNFIIVVSIAASTTSGKSLPKKVIEKTIDACDRAGCNLVYQKRTFYRIMECLVRLVVENYVFQLSRANLLQKLLTSSSIMEATVVLILD